MASELLVDTIQFFNSKGFFILSTVYGGYNCKRFLSVSICLSAERRRRLVGIEARGKCLRKCAAYPNPNPACKLDRGGEHARARARAPSTRGLMHGASFGKIEASRSQLIAHHCRTKCCFFAKTAAHLCTSGRIQHIINIRWN